MPNVVFDASSLVGALLKRDSIPERALLHARSNATICLSADVANEIREVFSRPKFQKYLASGRRELLLDIIENGAMWFEPEVRVEDCRDVKDNKYLELALVAGAEPIVSSDEDLLVLSPWRGIEIITPTDYVRRFEPSGPNPF